MKLFSVHAKRDMRNAVINLIASPCVCHSYILYLSQVYVCGSRSTVFRHHSGCDEHRSEDRHTSCLRGKIPRECV